MTDLCREMEKEPMCGSVGGGNTISIVRLLVVNGTAREISALSPEEHLRTEHQRVFFFFFFLFPSLCKATVSLNYLRHRDSAACRTEGRGNETE